jgi:hypothetical protein
MKCYPLGIAGPLAIACERMRRADVDGAQTALARATALAHEEDAPRSKGDVAARPGAPADV